MATPQASTPATRTDAEWRARLTPEQYRILRQKGTERAFTGAYNDAKEKGVYRCAACGTALFTSDEKFDSGSGWPSVYDVVSQGHVVLHEDRSYGMRRTEVTCGGHLGHLDDDGPRQATGLRYCINSASLALDTSATPEEVKANSEACYQIRLIRSAVRR